MVGQHVGVLEALGEEVLSEEISLHQVLEDKEGNTNENSLDCEHIGFCPVTQNTTANEFWSGYV